MTSKSQYIHSIFEDFLGSCIPKDLVNSYFLSNINEDSFDELFFIFLAKINSDKSLSLSKSIKSIYLLFLDRMPGEAEITEWKIFLSSNSFESFLNALASSNEALTKKKYSDFKQFVIHSANTEVPSISDVNSLIRDNKYSAASHFLSYLEYFNLSPLSLINQKKWELSSRIPKRKLYIDITCFYKYRSKTGIQRVVSKIYDSYNLSSKNRDMFEILPVAIYDDNIVVLRDFILEKTDIFISSCVNYTPNLFANDILLLLDLNSNITSAVNTKKLIKKSNIFVWGLVYDLLPIFNPSWWPEGAQKIHLDWFQTIHSLSNGYSCISNEVLNVSRELVSSMNWPTEFKETYSFNLGSDFTNLCTSASLKQKNSIKNSTVFLAVGTIEPRKGYYDILDAFDKLMKDKYPAVLHIVGKYGWLMDNFEDKYMQLKKLYPEKIYWHSGCSDQKLNSLYNDSDCLIQASYDEGYGLPIVEAIMKSKLIICRDIPVFHEVGKNYPLYFNNNEPQNTLFDVCKTVCTKTYTRPSPDSAQTNLITWDESSVILAEQIFSAYEKRVASSAFVEHNPSNLTSSSKTIFVYIGHTVSYEKVSGIQDVVRQIVSGLTNQGISIALLGWNEKTSNLEVLNKDQLEFFLQNTRHPFELNRILNLTNPTLKLEDRDKCSSILIMPELPYLSSTRYDICTLIASCFAKYFDQSICIYYDSIPLVYPLYNHLALQHYNYLCSLPFYNKILSISEFSRLNLFEVLDEYGIHLDNSDQIFTVPLGKINDFQLAALSHETHLHSASPYILAVGSMIPHKNWLTLVTAYSLFRERAQKFLTEVPKLNLVSAASPENIQLVEKYDGVQLLSSISEDDIYRVYSNSLFCVFPSTLEGFGLPILEAAQFAKVSLFHNHGAPSETASYSNFNPLCGCDMSDPFQISSKLEWLCKNSYTNLKSLQNSFSALPNSFDESSYVNRLISFI